MIIDVLDDDPLEHLVMEKLIGTVGPSEQIKHCTDGRELLTEIEQHSNDYTDLPDIIFLDIHMPKMSGWTFLDEFSKIEPRLKKKIDLYIVSSSIDPGDISRSKKYPFVRDYLFKPVSPAQLRTALNINVNANRR